MEANTAAIAGLGWARWLDLPDDALTPTAGPARLRVERANLAMVVRLWRQVVVVGPGWLHDRVAELPAEALADQTVLLRCCADHRARLVGQAVLAFADHYLDLEGLEDVPVTDEPEAVAALERACPPDDVTEVALGAKPRVLVTLDVRAQPTAGAGYDEWQGILAHLGVLTPPEQRRSGHGTTAAALAVHDALDAGLVPQWRARVDNLASRRMARRLGFTEVGSQTTVALG